MGKWRWQDYLSLLVGVWVMASPWVLGFADTQAPLTWSAVISGAAVALLAAFDLEILSKVDEWILVGLGSWLIASPWVLGSAATGPAAASMVLSGIVVIVLTLWEIGAADGWRWLRDHVHG
jgi:hypothetical protein